jgi:hypothetical protein
MKVVVRWFGIALLSALAAACGDDPPGSPDAAPTSIDAAPDAFTATCDEARMVPTLRALPNVIAVGESTCGPYVDGPARCFSITIEQPVDHRAAQGAKLQQHLYLTHRGCDRPTVIADWGYSNEYFFDDELSVLYGANALWIEHRYQGVSVPATADWSWSALTIENGAKDMHRVIESFHRHYGGRFVTTGASKGGITATYHRYFFPKDVDGSIPYVAPASRARLDPLYQDYLTSTLPAPCAPRIRDVQVAALTSRRPMMLQRMTDLYGPTYASVYLEYVMTSFDWAFWQYRGASYCNGVPTAAASDAVFWDFVAQTAGLSGPAPAPPATMQEMSDGALTYEWLTEQGFALQVGAHVAPLLQEPLARETMEDRFRVDFPSVALPAYNGAVTADVRRWVRDEAEDMLLIYGQYDPWSGGSMETPMKATSGRFFVPSATHGAAIMGLASAERTAALAHATRMFGRGPSLAAMPAARRAAEVRQSLLDAKARRMTSAAVRLR